MGLYNCKIVRKARADNAAEERNEYHHPTESDVIHKNIDLTCQKPMCEINEPFKSNGYEKWLEAYVIQLAKRSNKYQSPFQLTGVPNYFLFLDSQRNFRQDTSNYARPLDCLFFEPDSHHLVVIELKATRKERGKAITELNHYTQEILEIKEEIASVFGLDEISGVEGYVVWPGDDRRYGKEPMDFGDWGVIGYSGNGYVNHGKLTKPWELFETQGYSIQFTKYRSSVLRR